MSLFAIAANDCCKTLVINETCWHLTSQKLFYLSHKSMFTLFSIYHYKVFENYIFRIENEFILMLNCLTHCPLGYLAVISKSIIFKHIIQNSILDPRVRLLSGESYRMKSPMRSQHWLKVAGTKPLPEPVLTEISTPRWCH